MAEALRHAEQANAELRELAHGILPAALTRGGLRAGVEALVSRVSLPVSVDVAVERLPAGVEATAYFVVSEALTNVVKHAHASAPQSRRGSSAGSCESRFATTVSGGARRARHRLGRARGSGVGAGWAPCAGEPAGRRHARVRAAARARTRASRSAGRAGRRAPRAPAGARSGPDRARACGRCS